MNVARYSLVSNISNAEFIIDANNIIKEIDDYIFRDYVGRPASDLVKFLRDCGGEIQVTRECLITGRVDKAIIHEKKERA
jgi:hypothetical protein